MHARLIVWTLTAASVMSEVEMGEYKCGPKRGQRFQLRDARGESPSILALGRLAARVIPYYYSFTGSQPSLHIAAIYRSWGRENRKRTSPIPKLILGYF